MNKKSTHQHIPHNRPTLGIEEEKMALEVIQSGWVAQGNEVERFENEFCDFLGLPRGSAVAVSSGSAALYLALCALEAKGKNISIPVYTCSALSNAIALVGGEQLLVDCMHDSPNMDINEIDESTNIAIIPHMFGIPQIISKESAKIKVIEDCAQSLGASINHLPVGLQGDVGVFSFYATKLMTTGGQGGIVLSKDSSMIDFLKDYRNFDGNQDNKNRFNFQMTDLQASIGRAQLRKFPIFLKRRAEIFNLYKEAKLPLLDAKEGAQSVRFRAILKTSKQYEIIKALQIENISAVIPILESELMGSKDFFANAYYWSRNTVSLPIYPSLTNEEVERIIRVVGNVL